jgi:hypothetical protein
MTMISLKQELEQGLRRAQNARRCGKRTVPPADATQLLERAGFQLGQPQARIRRADVRKQQFREWLWGQMDKLGDRERLLARRARWAEAALQLGVGWPTVHLAWLVIADWHKAQRTFNEFWEQATDKCGRLQLYSQWCRGRAA